MKITLLNHYLSKFKKSPEIHCIGIDKTFLQIQAFVLTRHLTLKIK